MARPGRQFTTYPAIVGRVLALVRKDAGVTQERVAKHLGISQSAWSKIERGTVAVTVEQLGLLAPLLNQTPGQLLCLADRIVDRASDQGIRVEAQRPTHIPVGLVVLGGGALGLLVAALLQADERG